MFRVLGKNVRAGFLIFTFSLEKLKLLFSHTLQCRSHTFAMKRAQASRKVGVVPRVYL